MAEVTLFAADRLEDRSVEVGERVVLDISAPETQIRFSSFPVFYLLVKVQRPGVPAPDGDVVHAGVLSYLEVHDVVVAGGVAVLVEHHELLHVGEFEFSQIFLETFHFSVLLKFYIKEFFSETALRCYTIH